MGIDETGANGTAKPGSGRRWSRSRLVVLGLVAMLLPALGAFAGIAYAAAQFEDVTPGSTHAPGIDWLVGAGVTAGCNQAGTLYCPGDGVTRAQMATFMHRLSGNAEGIAPSVDAATVEGLTAAELQGQQGPAGPQGPQGPQGPEGPAGPAGEDATVLWVVVEANGDLSRGSGVVSTAKFQTPPGEYEVIFDQDVSACSYQATVGQSDSGSTDGFATVARRAGNANGVFLVTSNASGTQADRPFHLSVFC
jgi:hypothetical protein